MAYQVCFWTADGPWGEACLSSIRIDRVAHAAALARHRPADCDRVTLERTDRPSRPVVRVLWLRRGYVDPFA